MNEKMPETLEAALKGAEILLAENGDISADGIFGERWFVFTPEELRIYSSDGAEPCRLDMALPVGKVSALETLDMVGCGALEARTPQGVTQLLRYSAAKARDFARAAKKFKEWKEAGEFAPESKEELDDNRCPQCRLPLAEGTKICPVCSEKGQAVRRLLFLAAAHRWRLALVLLLTVTYNVAHLMPPYMTKRIIDDILTPRQNLHLLKWFVLFFAGLLVLQTVIQTAIGFLSARLGHVVVRDLRNRLFAHVQRLAVSFYDKFKTGTLMSRIDHDTNQLMGFLVDGLQYTVINVLTIVGIGVWLFILNWRLAFLVLIPTPLVVLATLKVWKRLHQAFHRWRESHARLTANLQDTISGVRIVKAFAQEPREISRFNSRSEDLYQAGVHVDRQFAALFPMMNLLMSSGALLVWYFGGYDVGGGRMSLGDLVAFNLYIGMFYGPFSMLTRISQWFNRHVTAAQRVFEIMDMDVEAPGDTDAQAMPYIEGRVAFKNATFGYDKLKPVLKSVSFEARPGEMIGLVGHSGAGKSTSINLLLRFYNCDDGALEIDGVDIRNIKQQDLRSQIGVVPQEPMLFSGPIWENIGYAKPAADREEMLRAALAANAHDFIMKNPDGYDAEIGERGVQLSGGEKQRLMIARAILHDPRILILDEATAMVDVETEDQIQQAMARLVEGRTTFAIAHRLSTLRNADRLVVLKEGEVVESGTHEELMRMKGEYHKLVKLHSKTSKVVVVDG